MRLGAVPNTGARGLNSPGSATTESAPRNEGVFMMLTFFLLPLARIGGIVFIRGVPAFPAGRADRGVADGAGRPRSCLPVRLQCDQWQAR